MCSINLPDIIQATITSRNNKIKQQELTTIQSHQNLSFLSDQTPIIHESTNQCQKLHILSTPHTPITAIKSTTSLCTYATCESPKQLTSCISSEFNFNDKQQIAYQICVKWFLKLNKLQNSNMTNPSKTCLNNPLPMFLTGPGGTRKTHIVSMLKAVRNKYHSLHHICLLAPIGSAASIIGGQFTLALKLKYIIFNLHMTWTLYTFLLVYETRLT